MRIVQTYNILDGSSLNYRGGYLSPFVNWLSIAYSGLLIKKYNPNFQLVMYTSKELAYTFKYMFKLPYDEYVIMDAVRGAKQAFYCYPKILTYSDQVSPFIHVDCDVFCKEPLSKRLLGAGLVAQHEENDSKFYMLVLNHMHSLNVEFPGFMDVCFGENSIHSYNAGFLGGNNVDFYKEYIKEIMRFLDINSGAINKSDRKFLFNVVFEQWMFYALTRLNNVRVETYIKDTVVDFSMPWGTVAEQVLEPNKYPFIHIMNYKGHVRCDSFIVRQMLKDYPEHYARILRVCQENGIAQQFITTNDCIYGLMDASSLSDVELMDCKIHLSPDVRFERTGCNSHQLFSNSNSNSNLVILKTHDNFLSQDIRLKYNSVGIDLLRRFNKPTKLREITGDLSDVQQSTLIKFVRKGIFDNVLKI